jgi:hypothetical protein
MAACLHRGLQGARALLLYTPLPSRPTIPQSSDEVPTVPADVTVKASSPPADDPTDPNIGWFNILLKRHFRDMQVRPPAAASLFASLSALLFGIRSFSLRRPTGLEDVPQRAAAAAEAEAQQHRTPRVARRH